MVKRKMSMMIGITGGIGSGKSAVTAYLRSRGERVICADETARNVVRPGNAGSVAIRGEFGDAFFHADGTLNRKKLGDEVFSDAQKRDKLNMLLHPIIIEEMFEQAQANDGRLFLDAALLIQTGMHERVDHVWLVIADAETRIRRVMKRDNVDRREVGRRINVQLSDEQMIPYASELIENNGDLLALHKRVDALIKKPKYGGVKHGNKAE